MNINIIVACDVDGAIGFENRLLWHLPQDMKYFREKTKGHHILMGRKTFESIGKALPLRKTLVISRNNHTDGGNLFFFNDIKQAISFAERNNETDVWVCGGSEIYRQFENIATHIYLTRIEARTKKADSYFELPLGFELVSQEHVVDFYTNDIYMLTFEVYKRSGNKKLWILNWLRSFFKCN